MPWHLFYTNTYSSNLAIFSIPNILNPILWSSRVGESDGTMEIGKAPNQKCNVFYVLDSNTVICSLYSISRFLVYWLGPWPVTQVSPVQSRQSH